MKTETIAEEFAREAVELRKSTLPSDVRAYAKRLLLDYCGNAIAGTQTDSYLMASRAFSDVTTGPSVIIGSQRQSIPEYAALINAIAAHSLEMDDIQNRSSIHLGVVVIPATLAAAEAEKVNGTDLIRAIVAGYEVTGRIGRAVNPADHYARGFHPTSTCGPYGAAAGAALVMGLDRDQMRNAISLASVGSAGLLQFLHDGSLIKRLHPGWASHAGIIAARLGKAGYTGPRAIFEGEKGFLQAYSAHPDEQQARGPWQPIGRELLDTAIKPHATCRYNQSPVDGVLQIVTDNDLKPDDIASIEIDLLSVAWPIVANPEHAKRNPQSVVDAQFSVFFAAAVAATRRSASVDEHTPETIASPAVKEMMEKVSARCEPSLDKAYPQMWPSSVRIVSADGRTFKADIDRPKGDPANPLTWEETVTKFLALTARCINEDRQHHIVGLIDRLEELGDIQELTTEMAEP